MPDGVFVETQDLRTKAAQIKSLNFSNSLLDKPIVVPPDLLPLSKSAVDNLNSNASHVYQCQSYGDREDERLAETLDSVAAAYDEVDAAAQATIDGNGAPAEPVTPKANSIPDPTPPLPMGNPADVSAGGYADVEKTQTDLATGDNAASLRDAAQEWIRNGNTLQSSAQTFKEPIQNWEGEAAQQAYQKFNAYGDWLFKLGTSWHQLAGEAMRISDAHVKAMFQHTPVYQQYVELKTELMRAQSLGGGLAHQISEKMADLQLQSDEIREAYAREANPDRIEAPDPPPSSAPTTPVTGNGTKPADTGPGPNSPGGPNAPSPSGGPPPETPQTAPVSPMSAQEAGKGSPAGGGAPQSGSGGGSPSGGSGSGGGMPGGGSPGGDMPKELPKFPGDPSLQPAASGAGGGGSGGGAGGGGGAPNIPLQPAVGGVAVGPGPSAGGTAGAGAPTAGSGGGAMGGMGGGMAPMHGAQGQGGGTERKRIPGLSPDEELYNEDRPWTEGYIGQPQRKAGQSTKEPS